MLSYTCVLGVVAYPILCSASVRAASIAAQSSHVSGTALAWWPTLPETSMFMISLSCSWVNLSNLLMSLST